MQRYFFSCNIHVDCLRAIGALGILWLPQTPLARLTIGKVIGAAGVMGEIRHKY